MRVPMAASWPRERAWHAGLISCNDYVRMAMMASSRSNRTWPREDNSPASVAPICSATHRGHCKGCSTRWVGRLLNNLEEQSSHGGQGKRLSDIDFWEEA